MCTQCLSALLPETDHNHRFLQQPAISAQTHSTRQAGSLGTYEPIALVRQGPWVPIV